MGVRVTGGLTDSIEMVISFVNVLERRLHIDAATTDELSDLQLSQTTDRRRNSPLLELGRGAADLVQVPDEGERDGDIAGGAGTQPHAIDVQDDSRRRASASCRTNGRSARTRDDVPRRDDDLVAICDAVSSVTVSPAAQEDHLHTKTGQMADRRRR